MKWKYWSALYTQTYCTARGLRPRTIQAYLKTLEQFREYVRFRLADRAPETIRTSDVLVYVEFLRQERHNGAAAVNRHSTILRNFYRAMVSMGHLMPRDNPMEGFPKIKPPPRNLPQPLGEDEVQQLLKQPRKDTVLGLRDRALLALFYGTGIRVSEAGGLRETDVDWEEATIRVVGKGGHERVIPLNDGVKAALQAYRTVRGPLAIHQPLFRSRKGRALSRRAIYERVRYYGRKARISKRVYPHRLRHTCATHLVRQGVDLVTLRDLLGHRHITSTQIYIHLTVEDLRRAADQHPVSRLIERVEGLLPNVKMRFQHPPEKRFVGFG